MYSHVLVSSVKPKYSFRYARSQMDLSLTVMLECCLSDDGGVGDCRSDASMCARLPLMYVCGGFASI